MGRFAVSPTALRAGLLALVLGGCGGSGLGRPIERLAPTRYLRPPPAAVQCGPGAAEPAAARWPPPALPGRRSAFVGPARPLRAQHPPGETRCCGGEDGVPLTPR